MVLGWPVSHGSPSVMPYLFELVVLYFFIEIFKGVYLAEASITILLAPLQVLFELLVNVIC